MIEPDRSYVFVSYSHDSEEHNDRILQMANRLRHDGVNCEIDQFEPSPPEGWPEWMLRAVHGAQHVVVVITQGFSHKLERRRTQSKASGVAWEIAAVLQELYDSGGHNKKFIPIVLSSSDTIFIPLVLRSSTYFDLSMPDAYDGLLALLTGQERTYREPVGPVRAVLKKGQPDAASISPPLSFESLERRTEFPGQAWIFADIVSGIGLTCHTTNLKDDRIVSSPNCRIEVSTDEPDELRQGWRILLQFFGIPRGCRIGMVGSISPASSSPAGVLFLGSDRGGAAGSPVQDSTALYELDVDRGSSGDYGFATTTYGLIRSVKSLSVPVTIAWDGECDDGDIRVGSLTVSVSLAPLAKSVPPEPGTFLNTSGDPGTLFSLIRCATVLLFPLVSIRTGSGTVLTVVNTSRDYFGSNTHEGCVTFHFHANESSAPSPKDQTSVVIPAGGQLSFDLTSGNSTQGLRPILEGFSGYVYAVCEFGPAHGMAFQFSADEETRPLFSYPATVVPIGENGVDQWPHAK